MTADLWSNDSSGAWRRALDRYIDVVARQGVARLAELDAWYREELPHVVATRRPPHATHAELVRLTEWKMARGIWRAPNLVLVRGNDPEEVARASAEALALSPHPRAPIARLAELKGVGPATASALMAAMQPERYPFFDELVAAQVPALGTLAWTLGFYVKYAEALRARAERLGGEWTPVLVERALWANAGGKARVA
ncbi:MAG TPA: hypothetical protein VJU87_07025 [Gemmatimonadaceae bacterium]|nr:hypothetical protein [Gemmatimonadaceae bacterium]